MFSSHYLYVAIFIMLHFIFLYSECNETNTTFTTVINKSALTINNLSLLINKSSLIINNVQQVKHEVKPEKQNMLRTLTEKPFEEGYFSRFVRRMLELLGTRFKECKLKGYCTMVRQLLDKQMQFQGLVKLKDIFRDFSKRENGHIRLGFQDYLKMYEQKNSRQIEFLKAMDNLLVHNNQKAMILENYIDQLKQSGEGKLPMIRKITKDVIKAIIAAIFSAAPSEREDINWKLNKCFNPPEDAEHTAIIGPSLLQDLTAKLVHEAKHSDTGKYNGTEFEKSYKDLLSSLFESP